WDPHWNLLRTADLAALLRSPFFRVRELDLSGEFQFIYVEWWNPFLEPDAFAVLASSPAVASVTELYLNENNVAEEGVRALLESPDLIRLTGLRADNPSYVEGSRLRPDLVRALRERFGVSVW